MKHYIIDGNNLIGKIDSLKKMQQKDKQHSREKLASMVDNHFRGKKLKITIHFDGFENIPIKPNSSKIVYSDNKSADENIKKQIELSKNRKNLVVITSDNNIQEFARVCSSGIMKSEEFLKMIERNEIDEEKNIIDKMKNDMEKWIQLFEQNEDQ